MTEIVLDYQAENLKRGMLYPTDKRIQNWLDQSLEILAIDEALEVTVRLVDADEMQELNHDYRGKETPTNVLSFPCDWDLPEEPRLLGDIVICVPVIAREAKEQKKTLEEHWAHMVIHGLLHLLGYDHIEEQQAEEMEALECRILAHLGYKNPYILEE